MRTHSRDLWFPDELEGLPSRDGPTPRLAVPFPCLQVEDTAPEPVYNLLLAKLSRLPACQLVPYEHPHYPNGTMVVVLDDDLARGQPEAFISGTAFAVVRPDGSCELRLRPEWAAFVVRQGWGTIHPLARYMSGPIPPQTLIIFAPRDPDEIPIIVRIVRSALWYARGEVRGVPLPDTRW